MTMVLLSSGRLSPRCTGFRQALEVATTSATGSILGRTGLLTPLSRSLGELLAVSGRTARLVNQKLRRIARSAAQRPLAGALHLLCQGDSFIKVHWSKTKAYALGLYQLTQPRRPWAEGVRATRRGLQAGGCRHHQRPPSLRRSGHRRAPVLARPPPREAPTPPTRQPPGRAWPPLTPPAPRREGPSRPQSRSRRRAPGARREPWRWAAPSPSRHRGTARPG